MDVLRLNPQPDQTERPKNEPGPVCGAPEIGRSLTAKSLLRVIVEYGRWPKRQRNETYFLGRCPQATMNIAFGEKITDRIAIGGHCTFWDIGGIDVAGGQDFGESSGGGRHRTACAVPLL